MNNIVNQTGVPQKNSGDGLTAKEMNSINSTINTEVEVGNAMLRSFFNANLELGDYGRQLTLGVAIGLVPEERKNPGMTVHYLNTEGKYVDYIFSGNDISNWNNTDYWTPAVTRIDGGEW